MTAPATLRAAAVLVALEAIPEAVVIARREDLVPGFRVCLILVLALKWVWVLGALKLRPASVMGLFLLEGMSALAALGATHAPMAARLALAASALAAIVLLASSLHAFPEPELP